MGKDVSWEGLWQPDRDQVSDLAEQLQEVAAKLGPARPCSGLVRRGPGVVCVTGWRTSHINETLDRCSLIHGALFVDRADLVVDSAEYKRQWARDNVDKARENSRRQWQKCQVQMRAEYSESVALYGSIYPDVPAPGFDTWRRQFRSTWLADRAVCLVRMHAWKAATMRGVGGVAPDGDWRVLQAPANSAQHQVAA